MLSQPAELLAASHNLSLQISDLLDPEVFCFYFIPFQVTCSHFFSLTGCILSEWILTVNNPSSSKPGPRDNIAMVDLELS